ncbi:hypothetical protein MTO96_043288, partial [Rhipicephalus appendiculatus]
PGSAQRSDVGGKICGGSRDQHHGITGVEPTGRSAATRYFGGAPGHHSYSNDHLDRNDHLDGREQLNDEDHSYGKITDGDNNRRGGNNRRRGHGHRGGYSHRGPGSAQRSDVRRKTCGGSPPNIMESLASSLRDALLTPVISEELQAMLVQQRPPGPKDHLDGREQLNDEDHSDGNITDGGNNRRRRVYSNDHLDRNDHLDGREQLNDEDHSYGNITDGTTTVGAATNAGAATATVAAMVTGV